MQNRAKFVPAVPLTAEQVAENNAAGQPTLALSDDGKVLVLTMPVFPHPVECERSHKVAESRWVEFKEVQVGGFAVSVNAMAIVKDK